MKKKMGILIFSVMIGVQGFSWSSESAAITNEQLFQLTHVDEGIGKKIKDGVVPEAGAPIVVPDNTAISIHKVSGDSLERLRREIRGFKGVSKAFVRAVNGERSLVFYNSNFILVIFSATEDGQYTILVESDRQVREVLSREYDSAAPGERRGEAVKSTITPGPRPPQPWPDWMGANPGPPPAPPSPSGGGGGPCGVIVACDDSANIPR